MTRTVERSHHRRNQWISRVRSLANQISEWSRQQGWLVKRLQRTIEEEGLGKYRVPALEIQMPERGELLLTPIALEVLGGDGRVDLHAHPTLFRVKLIPTDNGWEIMTDSGVPLRRQWNSETFVQLAQDLVS